MEDWIVGVVADTHVPDRAAGLHPRLLPELRAAGVQRILHAGDVCTPATLRKLETVAPVLAVRGNRDWVFGARLARAARLELGGFAVAVVHGHGSLPDYLRDKWAYLLDGYSFQRYRALWDARLAGAEVIVFGHTHHPENAWHDGRLWFNPGSAAIGETRGIPPSFGLLRFTAGQVCGTIVPLIGARLVGRRWVGE